MIATTRAYQKALDLFKAKVRMGGGVLDESEFRKQFFDQAKDAAYSALERRRAGEGMTPFTRQILRDSLFHIHIQIVNEHFGGESRRIRRRIARRRATKQWRMFDPRNSKHKEQPNE
ncbi:MAG TPA: hypothetical protein VKX49_12655 [Bryobacteraceae bacterium]|nr:hypothetical protein [Bryobacteraceae bacterium]